MKSQTMKSLPESIQLRFLALMVLILIGSASLAFAQTSSFTYQGRFTESGTPANGTYDMQFRMFDSGAVGGGNQISSTINNGAVSVKDGIFTVQLDYGAGAFSGADRYLEIGIRPAGSADAYTLLSPRQQLTSAVYAIRAGSATIADNATNANTATNATQLGGVAANEYVQMGDARLSDPRTPTAGSSNYIQNANNQQAANFNISGNGTAGGTLSAKVVNTTTSYNLGGNPMLSIGGLATQGNTFTGFEAGIANQPSFSFDGTDNSFYGFHAGATNTTGGSNSFFGRAAGGSNKTGSTNSFFGAKAGVFNDTGKANAFFGASAGYANSEGSDNVFVGDSAGSFNTTGFGNVFIGSEAGHYSEAGGYLTLIGRGARVGQGNILKNASAIGAYATVTKSNSLVLGAVKSVALGTEDTDVGIGTTAPNARFHIAVNGGNIVMGHAGCSPGFAGIGFGSSLSNCGNYSLLGNGTSTMINRATGGSIEFRENNTPQMTIASGGVVSINTLGASGIDHLCRNASNQISNCSSSLRYKTNIQPFISGLSVLNRLRPITFDWKQGGMHDLGFGAEEIAAVEPLLVTHNDKGEVEGVKYDRITAVLVNAVKEQQAQIKQQQSQIQSLKKLVCQRNRRAAVCK